MKEIPQNREYRMASIWQVVFIYIVYRYFAKVSMFMQINLVMALLITQITQAHRIKLWYAVIIIGCKQI